MVSSAKHAEKFVACPFAGRALALGRRSDRASRNRQPATAQNSFFYLLDINADFFK